MYLKRFLGTCKDNCLLIFPLTVSLLIMWSRYQGTVSITMDGVTYLQIARNILFGQGLGWQALWAPPLHSILIAAGSYLSGTENLLAVAAALAALFGFLLIPVIYFLASHVFNRTVALIASLLAAVSPHFLYIAQSPEAEVTYTFFLTLSLFLFTLMVTRGTRIFAVLTGISFALAYLGRSEGFLIMMLVIATVLAMQGWRFYRTRLFVSCSIVLVVFLVTVSPYLFFLKKNYGSWVISPKTSYVMIWMKWLIYHDNNKGEQGNEELWGLNSEGKLRWQEPKGIKDLIVYLGSHPQKSLNVYLHNLSREIPGRISNSSGMDDFPQVFPIYLAMAALAATFMGWGRQGKTLKGVLLAPFLILLIFPIFTEGWWKYLVAYLPIMMVLAAKGIAEVARYVAGKFDSQKLEIFCLVVMVGVMGWFYTVPLRPAFKPSGAAKQPEHVDQNMIFKRLLREEARKAGEYGLQLFGPGHNYMVEWSPIIYYLDGLWTALPVSSDFERLRYARRNHAEYLVLQAVDSDITLDAISKMPGISVVGYYQSATIPFKVFFARFNPILY